MSVKGSYTTAEPLEWNEANNLMNRLYEDGKFTISLLVGCGIYFGLRISDILRLTWDDLLAGDTFILFEKKTGKRRIVKINPTFKRHIEKCYAKMRPRHTSDLVFISKSGQPYTTNRLNVMFKSIRVKYRLNITHFSTHTLRKTFATRIYKMAGDKSEDALIRLSAMFSHSSTAITRAYIGLTSKVMMDTYDLL
jgi:integrase